ncbi:hypothetical protein H4S01_003118, partial [Coemansia sp. RSA 2610]
HRPGRPPHHRRGRQGPVGRRACCALRRAARGRRRRRAGHVGHLRHARRLRVDELGPEHLQRVL